VDDLPPGALKDELEECKDGPFEKTDFSIGHRGAALQFPEHTREAYVAGARMGAGILECDVTFTADRELVCRHSQCDLHTTTNILAVPELAAKCSVPFTPADPVAGTPANAQCCTSDITLAEFKTLCGKMDAFDPNATTVEQYLGGTPTFRTDLYATCGTLLSHAESIELLTSLGTKFTPELKAPSVSMPFEGSYTQEAYAQQMIDEYKAAGISPRKVFAQSFNLSDVSYWLEHEPAFGKQAVYLDDRVDVAGGYDAAVASLPDIAALGSRHARRRAAHRAVELCARRPRRGAGPHHLDAGALGPARHGRRLLLPVGVAGHPARQRLPGAARRAGSTGRRARRVLRLGRHRHLLRQLRRAVSTSVERRCRFILSSCSSSGRR
jgi:glycerophosphoryl diester phosphodiesterase